MKINKIPFLYDQDWIEHQVFHSKFNGYDLIEDFTIKDSNIIFPLMVFKSNSTLQKTALQNGFFTLTPLLLNRDDYNSRKYVKLINKKTNEVLPLIKDAALDSFYIQQFPGLTFRKPFTSYSEISKKTILRGRNLVDLALDFDSLWSHVRPRYRSSINKVEEVEFYFGDIPDNVFNNLVHRHFELAGRKTKPDICWEILKSFVKNKKAFICKYQNDFLYFMFSEDYSYYSISCAEKNKKNVTHILMWNAIKFAKKQGSTLMDLGVYYPGEICENPLTWSEKEDFKKIKQISNFKNGFASHIYPDFYDKII